MPRVANKNNPTSALRNAREQLYRQHIFAVAESLFAEQGFAQTRMQEIAQQAEVSLTTLYQLCPGKQELYRQVLIERDQDMLEAVSSRAQALLQQPADLSLMLEILHTQIRYLLEHPDYLRMQLNDGLLWFHNTSRPSVGEQQLWERGLALIEQLFVWGEREGLFRSGVPVEQGRLMLSMQQTRLANWVLGDMKVSHDAVVANIQEDFVRLFCVPARIGEYVKENSIQT